MAGRRDRRGRGRSSDARLRVGELEEDLLEVGLIGHQLVQFDLRGQGGTADGGRVDAGDRPARRLDRTPWSRRPAAARSASASAWGVRTRIAPAWAIAADDLADRALGDQSCRPR